MKIKGIELQDGQQRENKKGLNYNGYYIEEGVITWQ